MRPSKTGYYLEIAKVISTRGTCLRRNYGAVIVKNDEIISTGYTGAPRGRKNCLDIGFCIRNELKCPSGERYELCRSVHAEQNAIISARRSDMIGSCMYLAGTDVETGVWIDTPPCDICRKLIINAGIEKVITISETLVVDS
jgi:dCMP deaminase